MYKRINKLLGTAYESDKDIDWDYISRDCKLREDFIEEYKNQVVWGLISKYQTLSEPFIEKYKDLVSWYYISCCQSLSEPFIEKYKDLVDWVGISRYRVLSEDFLIKHKDRVNWNIVCSSQILSKEFMNNFIREEIIPDTFSIEGLWSIISSNQPFIDINNSLVNPRSLDKNGLYKLYQETREQGWFIGYTWLNNTKEGIYFSETLSFVRKISETKAKIYWKDLELIDRTKKYEPIRKIKFV